MTGDRQVSGTGTGGKFPSYIFLAPCSGTGMPYMVWLCMVGSLFIVFFVSHAYLQFGR